MSNKRKKVQAPIKIAIGVVGATLIVISIVGMIIQGHAQTNATGSTIPARVKGCIETHKTSEYSDSNAAGTGTNCPSRGDYQSGAIPDQNDLMHLKAQQQVAADPEVGSEQCDKGNDFPLCYNVGYYSGVHRANFDNSEHGVVLYSPVCASSQRANFCAGYIQGYSHTYAGHVTNASEIWNEGNNTGYYNGINMNPAVPLNGTNPASCTEGPVIYCDGYAHGYPPGIQYALGRELGAEAADHDWKSQSVSAKIPACPSEHTKDWCNGWNMGYQDEWDNLSEG
jgi:hypothetical protein